MRIKNVLLADQVSCLIAHTALWTLSYIIYIEHEHYLCLGICQEGVHENFDFFLFYVLYLCFMLKWSRLKTTGKKKSTAFHL